MSELATLLITRLKNGGADDHTLRLIDAVRQDPMALETVQQTDQEEGLAGVFLAAVEDDHISDFGSSMSLARRMKRLEVAEDLFSSGCCHPSTKAEASCWGGQPINALLRSSGELEQEDRQVSVRTCALVDHMVNLGATLPLKTEIEGRHASTFLHRVLYNPYVVIRHMSDRHHVFDQWAMDCTPELLLPQLARGNLSLEIPGYPRTYVNHGLLLVRVLLQKGQMWVTQTALRHGDTILHTARFIDGELTRFFLQHMDPSARNDEGLTVLGQWATDALVRKALGRVSYEQIQALVDTCPQCFWEQITPDSNQTVGEILERCNWREAFVQAEELQTAKSLSNWNARADDFFLHLKARAEQFLLEHAVGGGGTDEGQGRRRM